MWVGQEDCVSRSRGLVLKSHLNGLEDENCFPNVVLDYLELHVPTGSTL